MQRFNPKEIEPKWQKYWDKKQTYRAYLDSAKPKFVAMSMFNYPSGAGIHIGHAMNYTISDVLARFKRQQGYESYHPVGWDSFGLPAENYAIKAGVSPQASMATIIPNYHKQYKAMGWSNDWSKEIATHMPEYYKWTQWIFSEMFRAGLAYQDARMQWWCDKCQTVLANEQVINDKCWRHDSADDPEVTQREVKQWFFKITDYADELLEATDELDWTESVKLAQKNWIGKSVGAEVSFAVANDESSVTSRESHEITVFTTRADTLFGATFLVLAPEHELVKQITTQDQQNEVVDYVKSSIKKSEVERQANKEKTGVFTGSYAINPVNNEKIPIWVADYVLMGYGTGAIMAVPAHDDRDYEFARKFNLEICEVIKKPSGHKGCYDGEGEMINSVKYDGMLSSDAREKIVSELSKIGIAKEKVNFKMRDWSVSRQRYWGAPIPIIFCPDHGPVLVPDADLPVVLPELDDFAPSGDGRSALARAKDWLTAPCPACGKLGERETDTLDTYICSSWYMLRYFNSINEKQAFASDVTNKWMPIDFYNGADHATAHMIYARFITRFFHKKGLLDNPEPFKKFLFNGKVTAADGQMFSKSKGNGVDPLEIIEQGYGADALRTYLMFAAPLELWAKWDPKGVPATHRFLSRVWTLTQEFLESVTSHQSPVTSDNNSNIVKKTHQVIIKVTDDIENQHYNTAIAALMEFTNFLYRSKTNGFSDHDAWRFSLESLIMMIAPFAPHTAEDLWHQLGYDDTVHVGNWPQFDTEIAQEDQVTVAVQVNGKLRATIQVIATLSEEEVIKLALSEENVQKFVQGEVPRKTIYVPLKIVNIVV